MDSLASDPGEMGNKHEETPFRRILITGTNGFVGRHLLAMLGDPEWQSAEIVTAGRESNCGVFLDLADPASVRKAVRDVRPDLTIHLAGEASVAGAARAAVQTWQLNLGGSLALAAAVSEVAAGGTFLFVSSAEVYGDAFLEGPADEGVRPAPNSVYGETKLAAEQMLARVLPASTRLIIARPSNHIGPGQDERFAVANFAAQIVAGERAGTPITISVGNLDAVRDFSDVRDVVQAYRALLTNARAKGVYNIASGTPRSVRELLDMLRAAARVETSVEVDPLRQRPVDIPVAAVDVTRIAKDIAWKPVYPIERTISDILDELRRLPEGLESPH